MVKIINLKNINKAIIDQVIEGLKDTQFKDVKFSTTDIREKIVRPCFYLEFNSNETGLINKFIKERTLETKLYYFCKDKEKPKIEIMEIQEQLENIFLRYVKVKDDFYMYVRDVSFYVNKNDGFLIMDLELYSLEMIEEDSQGVEITSINTDIRRG